MLQAWNLAGQGLCSRPLPALIILLNIVDMPARYGWGFLGLPCRRSARPRRLLMSLGVRS